MSGELADAFEVLADLIARMRGPADRSVRGIGPVAPLVPVEQQPPVVMDGIEDPVPAAHQLPDALEVLPDLVARPRGPALRAVRRIGPVPPLVPVEQQPPVVVDGVEHAVAPV